MSANHVPSPRNRVEADASRPVRLTERDLQLIESVALASVVTRRQIMELGFFSSISRGNRRLRCLFDGGYLRRTFLACDAYAAEAAYLLGPAGAPIVAERTGLDFADIRRQAQRLPARTFLEHHIAMVEVRLAIEADAAKRGYEVVAHYWESECRHEYTLGKGQRRLVKPDGFFLVQPGNRSLAAFIEVDRGCVSRDQLAKTFRRYRDYLSDGAFTACYGQDTFDVLVVTTVGKRRIDNLLRLTRAGSPAIRLAAMTDIGQHGFFGAVWRSLDHDNGQSAHDLPWSRQ